MFRGLIETKKHRIEKKQMALFPIVIIIQAIMLGSFVISSAWSVSYIDEPPLIVTLAPAPPPPPPGVKNIPHNNDNRNKRIETLNEVPIRIFNYKPESILPAPNIVEGVVDGFEIGGDEEGIEGGFPRESTENILKEELKEKPVIIGGTVQGEKPKIISRIQPEYPEIARRARIEGIVILEAIIEKDGSVSDIKIIRKVSPLLDQAAVRAVKQWKFEPAKINGKPVRAYFILTVIFKIQ